MKMKVLVSALALTVSALNVVGAAQAADAKFVVKLGVAMSCPNPTTALWRASMLMSATASARRSRSSI